jgi:hypothetical protein
MLGRIRTITNSAASAYHIGMGVWSYLLFIIKTTRYIHIFNSLLFNSAEFLRLRPSNRIWNHCGCHLHAGSGSSDSRSVIGGCASCDYAALIG